MVDPHRQASLPAPEFATQHGFTYRFDWAEAGLHALAPSVSVIIIVDVLRFTSAVCTAVESGATVFPYPWADDDAQRYADERGAFLAGRREDGPLSLSPTDLLSIERGARLVLPSPNGSALSFAAKNHGTGYVLAGCLRNASATAAAARQLAGDLGAIAVIAAGERWNSSTGPIRHAAEDLLGAGAVLAALDPAAAVSAPRCSPEAAAARAAFNAARPRLRETIADTASARELIGRGWSDDVDMSSALDVTQVVAVLDGDAFVRFT